MREFPKSYDIVAAAKQIDVDTPISSTPTLFSLRDSLMADYYLYLATCDSQGIEPSIEEFINFTSGEEQS